MISNDGGNQLCSVHPMELNTLNKNVMKKNPPKWNKNPCSPTFDAKAIRIQKAWRRFSKNEELHSLANHAQNTTNDRTMKNNIREGTIAGGYEALGEALKPIPQNSNDQIGDLIVKLTQALKKCRTECEQKTNENAEMSHEIDALRIRNIELTTSVTILEKANSEIENKFLQDLNSVVSEKMKTLKLLEDNKIDKETQNEHVQNQNAQILTLETHISELTESLQSLTDKISTKEREIVDLQLVVADSSEKLDEQAALIKLLQDNNRNSNPSKQDVEILNNQGGNALLLSASHHELKLLREEGFASRLRESDFEEKHRCMTLKLAKVLNDNQLLKEDVKSLNLEIGRRAAETKRITEENTHLVAENMHKSENIKEMEASNIELTDANKKMDVWLLHLKSDLRKALKENKHLHEVNNDTTAKLDELETFKRTAHNHLQAQAITIKSSIHFRQRKKEFCRKSKITVQEMKRILVETREPFNDLCNEFCHFISQLKTPLNRYISKANNFATYAFSQEKLLREMYISQEKRKKHLHEQLWRVQENASMICQLRSSEQPATESGSQIFCPNYRTSEITLKVNRDKDRMDCSNLKFDHLYSESNRDICEHDSVLPLVESLFDGYNATVFCLENQMPFYTPDHRSKLEIQYKEEDCTDFFLDKVFDMCKNISRYSECNITMSYIGLYNEQIYDLLCMDENSSYNSPRLTCLSSKSDHNMHSQSKMVVLSVENELDAKTVRSTGLNNFKNAASEACFFNRCLTHRILTVCITSKNIVTGIVSKSKLNLVELAFGDEKNVTSDDTEGIRSRICLDKSLNSLFTVLKASRDIGTSYIPFQSSILTRVLCDSVTSMSKLLFFITLSKHECKNIESVLSIIRRFRGALYSHPQSEKVSGSALSIEFLLERNNIIKKNFPWSWNSASQHLINLENNKDCISDKWIKMYDDIENRDNHLNAAIAKNVPEKIDTMPNDNAFIDFGKGNGESCNAVLSIIHKRLNDRGLPEISEFLRSMESNNIDLAELTTILNAVDLHLSDKQCTLLRDYIKTKIKNECHETRMTDLQNAISASHGTLLLAEETLKTSKQGKLSMKGKKKKKSISNIYRRKKSVEKKIGMEKKGVNEKINTRKPFR